MSKYFDATLKARTLTPSAPARQREDAAEETAPPTAARAELSEPILGKPSLVAGPAASPSKPPFERRIHIPFDDIPQLQFGTNHSVESVEEAYRALRTRLLRLRSTLGLRSVVITSATQGEGKTLTALNLALSCARLNDLNVLLIDADIRSAGLSNRLGLPEERGLADVLSSECELEQAIVATDVPNLYLLGATARTAGPAELFADQRWRDFIGRCNERFGLVLVDAPPILDLSDVELITGGCDGVLMVVRALMTKRQTLEKCAGQIDAKKLLGVVYNGTAFTKRVSYGYADAPRKSLLS